MYKGSIAAAVFDQDAAIGQDSYIFT